MIFPAIDLQDGRSVRLYKGDFAKETIINPDPVDQASQYESAGVGALHLVDLDGAKAGKPVNVDIVKNVRAAFTGILEIGGGIRDKAAVDLYLEMGVNRVILGSVALKNPELTKEVIAEYGAERIVIGVDGKDGKVALVKVNMGAPILTSRQIPVVSTKEQVINEPLHVDGETYHITAVSMGNPHAIVYMDELKNLDIEKLGPKFENHINFPDRINTEFVKVIDRHTLQMRVWERGSGETLACGTGACAVAVASTLNGLVDEDKPVTVKLLGGDLQILWNRQENLVYMTGPATTVFDGEIDVSSLEK